MKIAYSIHRIAAAAALVVSALVAAPLAATAAEESPAFRPVPAPAPIQEAIRKRVAEQLPSAPKVTAILTTPLPGIFELHTEGSLSYVDAKADYFFQGSIIELNAGQRNLTKERLAELGRTAFAKMPLNDAIKIVKGNGSRKLVVFADPNCSYCKRLETSLKSIKDVTVYVYLIPILGDDSVTKVRDIWCASDKAKTWDAWMVDGKVPPSASTKGCDIAPIQRTIALSNTLQIRGTPALFFEDGTREPGALPTDVLENRLQTAADKVRKG